MHKKAILPLILILFLIAQTAAALTADVKLAWDPNSEPELKGYEVHYGTTPGTYSNIEDAGNQTTYTVTGLTEGTTYYFAVKAYSDSVKSDFSDEITYQVPVPVVTHTLTASAGSNGAISPSGPITVNQNTSQTFAITAAANYHVADVIVDGASVSAVTSYTFSNITADHSIQASFAIDTYTISASAGSNGTTSPTGSVSVNAGQSKTFTITPADNYHIVDVLVDSASIGAAGSHTFSNVTANHTISATFEQNAPSTYTITATADTNGAISPSGSVTIDTGTSKTFTITPNANYHITDVTVDGSSKGAISTYTFSNVTADHTISASFAIDTYTISASAGSNGTTSPTGSVSVNAGQSKTFTITPSVNYHITDVTVDGSSKGAISTYTFNNVTADHNIQVSFAIDTYTISASAGSNGTTSPTGSVSVNAGQSKTFTITPADNYHIVDVLVDSASIGAAGSHTFSNVTANHTISATFEQNAPSTYTITATADTNGAISPSGSVTIDTGTSKTFTITPNANYHITDVTVDGSSKGAISTYTFSNVTADHTISAAFAANAPTTYTVAASAGSNGSISPSDTVTVDAGKSQTFTITPSRFYQIDDIQIDGLSIGAVNSYTLAQINGNHTITASFKIGLPSCTEITLAWDESTNPAVIGHRVYYGIASGSYDTNVDVGSATSCTIDGLGYNQRYYFKIIAYTAAGENDYTDKFYYDTCKYKKLPPPKLRFLGFK